MAVRSSANPSCWAALSRCPLVKAQASPFTSSRSISISALSRSTSDSAHWPRWRLVSAARQPVNADSGIGTTGWDANMRQIGGQIAFNGQRIVKAPNGQVVGKVIEPGAVLGSADGEPRSWLSGVQSATPRTRLSGSSPLTLAECTAKRTWRSPAESAERLPGRSFSNRQRRSPLGAEAGCCCR